MGTLTEIISESKVNTHGIQDVEVRTLANDSVKAYRRKNGTYYHATTSDQVINTLERCRLSRDSRFKLDYGDVKTGISWNEEHDTTGYVSRSMGEIPVPILVANRRSLGGGAILDHCVIEVRYANKSHGGVIYRNPKTK